MVKKGQAAMEYLMTYGWALLIIIVVLAIFIVLLMNIPNLERCDLGSIGLICNNPIPVIEGSTLKLRLGNGLQEKITIQGFYCTDNTGFSAGDITTWDAPTGDADIQHGSYENYDVTCAGAGDVDVGQTYTGKLFIQYNQASDETLGLSPRIANAVVVVKKNA